MQWRKKRQATDAGTDTLSQLLEREQRLARELDAAREEARRLRDEANAYVEARDAACDVMIAERTARLVSTHEAQLEADLRVIAANTAADIRRFDELDATRANQLVAFVLEAIGATSASRAVTSG